MFENEKNEDVSAGAAVYSKFVLSIYDLYVLGFSNSFVWKCSSRQILAFYNKHISANHLDVGVGTGYFLDMCEFPIAQPNIGLLDLNENSLQTTATRLSRYHPTIYSADVCAPLTIEHVEFDSIALNYLLHCLSGNLLKKRNVFRNLKPLLNKNGGVMFGSTILGQGVEHNFLGKKLMKTYNAKGIFGNTEDNVADLETVLKDEFAEYSINVVGCVAFFVGQI